MTAARRSTPPDFEAVYADDPDGPASEVRPVVPLHAAPYLALTLEGLRFLPLDARTAYLLSLVDGHCSVETILDVAAPELQREEALRMLAQLVTLGAVELREP